MITVGWCEVLKPAVGIKPHRVTTERGSEMKTYTLIGIILIVIGIIALAYQGITYTTREKVVDIGPIQVNADKTKTIPLPPIVGGIALVGGIVLLVVGGKKS
jgi:uncharacterized membrane protein HdeD (DUF308 family)